MNKTTKDALCALIDSYINAPRASLEHMLKQINDKFEVRLRVPALDIDKVLYKESEGIPHARGIAERRVVFDLCQHMIEAGFVIHSVYDGDDETLLLNHPDPVKEAMELIFNLDEASLRFTHKTFNGYPPHGVLLVLGNADDGSEVIADWNYSKDDGDGFNKAVEAFTATLG